MARQFVSGSSNWLYSNSAPITNVPLTMACWFKPTGDSFNALISVGTAGSNDNRWTLNVTNAASGSTVTAQARNTANGIAQSSGSFISNKWNHAAGVFTSGTSRAVYLNGGNKGTNTANINILTTPNSVYVGANMGISANGVTGQIAEVAIWNIALSDFEIAMLANGANATLVRPSALVLYAPLLGDSPEVDYSGNKRNLTLNGSPPPAIANHAPVYIGFGYSNGIPYRVVSGSQLYSLFASLLTTGSPVFGTPVLREIVFQYARPSGTAYSGAWRTNIGGTDLHTAIDEVTPSDLDYVQSEDNPVSSVCAVSLSALGDPLSSEYHVLRYHYGKQTQGNSKVANVTVQLREGYVDEAHLGTLIAEWTHANIAEGITTAEQALTALQADSITDYSNLFLRLIGEVV